MNKDLRVLIVAAEENDAQLVYDVLSQKGFALETRLVQEYRCFVDTVKKENWDIIISNYESYPINGISVLNLLKQNAITVPCIIISDKEGIEPVVASFKAGAKDYLLKSELQKLPDSIVSLMNTGIPVFENRHNHELAQLLDLRRRAEEILEITQFSVDCAAYAIFRTDLNGRFLYVNESMCNTLKYSCEELLSLTIQNVSPHFRDSQWSDFLETLKKRLSFSLEAEFRNHAGKLLPLELTFNYFSYNGNNFCFGFGLDISERKQLEIQLLRAQRMECLGTLASGVAHDLNNVLAPILMAVQLLRQNAKNEALKPVLSILENSAQRGANLVKQMLTFGRGMQGDHILIQPRHLIREMAKIAEQTFPKNIKIEVDIPSDLSPVMGDPTQLHQVLLNLCINARDAMTSGGSLTLCAENITIDDSYTLMDGSIKSGKYVLITVTDSGCGIPAEIIDKIFNPFFTTKEIGKGTGLGLSTAVGIINNHVGFIRVSSQEGTGTQFKVGIPAAIGQEAVAQTLQKESLLLGNGECILVIEDEDPVREITTQILQNHNYQVLGASDGAEALPLYVRNRGQIRLVLTDMIMPIMGGMATIRSLMKINPHLPIIIMSGMASQENEAKDLDNQVRAFISKPFTAEQLLGQIKDILHPA